MQHTSHDHQAQVAIIQEEGKTPILDTEAVLILGQVEAEAHRMYISITRGLTYTGVGAAYAHNAKGYMMPSPDREEKKKALDQKLIKKSRGALQEYLEIVLAKKRKKDNG